MILNRLELRRALGISEHTLCVWRRKGALGIFKDHSGRVTGDPAIVRNWAEASGEVSLKGKLLVNPRSEFRQPEPRRYSGFGLDIEGGPSERIDEEGILLAEFGKIRATRAARA